MRPHLTLALAIGALALAFAPGSAVGVSYGPEYHPDPPAGPKYHPGQPGHAAPPAHAKAYGKRCQGQSKKHVKGQKGTAFSRCVKAMARAAADPNLKAKHACKALSKKHVKGQKGTPFSRCVKAVNQMRREERQQVLGKQRAY
jgi:hypothetical protein